MAAAQGVIDAIDRVIQYFNARRLDLPDGFFDRKTQFVINGAPFETLLGQPANDPLVLMLARGPAGFRFTSKTLQHAMPDAKLERGDVSEEASTLRLQLWLSGILRGTSEAVNTIIPITLKFADAGHVEIAEATVEPAVLEQLRRARLRP
jgi:hypothetical protein